MSDNNIEHYLTLQYSICKNFGTRNLASCHNLPGNEPEWAGSKMLKNPHQAVSSHEYFVEYSLCKVWSRWFRIPRSADLQEDCQILLGGRHSVATIVFPRRRVCDDPSPCHHVTGHQFTHMVLESLINGISIAKPRCQPLTTNIGAEADRHPEPVRTVPWYKDWFSLLCTTVVGTS